MNISEKWVLENALHNDINVIETVFFPQFKEELTEKKAPKLIGYQTPVYHLQPITFREWKETNYKKLRQAAYPEMNVQFDYIYHNGIEAWKNNMIKPVKVSFPRKENRART